MGGGRDSLKSMNNMFDYFKQQMVSILVDTHEDEALSDAITSSLDTKQFSTDQAIHSNIFQGALLLPGAINPMRSCEK